MLQRAIPQPLNDTWHLYKTGCNLRQYGMYLCTCMSMCMCACGHVCEYASVYNHVNVCAFILYDCDYPFV